ncbi:hypothetical protein DP117_23425 [Brasilonema sp. UFV-L1]|nr:hypothetical protein [Brasilonema sp. UFV-L1]
MISLLIKISIVNRKELQKKYQGFIIKKSTKTSKKRDKRTKSGIRYREKPVTRNLSSILLSTSEPRKVDNKQSKSWAKTLKIIRIYTFLLRSYNYAAS